MSAEEYNKKNVPIFAPNGFPCMDEPFSPWDIADVEELQFETGTASIDGFLGPQTIQAVAAMSGVRNRIFVGPKSFKMKAGAINFEEDFTLGDTASRTRRVVPHQIIIHYDVAYNARAAEAILQKRGYSTHFIIDGDGTIIQCHNPATKVAFHAGKTNDYSIGIDLNNAADPKYQDRDEQKNGRRREIITSTVHGHKVKRLAYHPEQIVALNELLWVLCQEFRIPKQCPRDGGLPVHGVVWDHKEFNGVLGHYHLTTRKTDPAPLDWDEVCP